MCGTVGFGLSTAAISLWSGVFYLILLPLWYWATTQPVGFGLFDVTSLPIALAVAGAGVVLFPFCGLLVRGLTRLELAMMVPLLRAPREERESLPMR